MKLAYWLSDVSESGRGNLKVAPGSHMVTWIDGPPRRDIQWPYPGGAIEVTAEPGDGVFSGHTYQWTAIRDDIAPMRASDWVGRLTPVQQQPPGGTEEPRQGPRMGPDPGDHLAVWLAERARLHHSSESAAAAPTLTSPGLRAMRLSRPVTHPARPIRRDVCDCRRAVAHDDRRASG